MRILLILALAILLMAGCAGYSPELSTELPRKVISTPVELRETPFFPQLDYQCGPAALAMVLRQSGKPVTAEDLVDKVYLPARKGSLQAELISATRRYGRIPYVIEPSLSALIQELQAGRAVLILQNLGWKHYPIWHYAVVIGYEPHSNRMILRSAKERRKVLTVADFNKTWRYSGDWGLVALRPGDMPAIADQDRYLKAVAALETMGNLEAAVRAYAVALERWPENSVARLGLGNVYYAQGQLDKAAMAYRSVLKTDPDHAVALNNLAQVLAEQGHYQAALRMINTALAVEPVPTVLRAAVWRTRADIINSRRNAKPMPDSGQRSQR